MRSIYRLASVAALGLGLLAAPSANAFAFYAQILTSTASPAFPNVTADITLDVDFDPLTFDWTGSTSSPGLGAPLVTAGSPKTFTLSFDPTPDAASVLRAWVFISVVDDQFFDPSETATLELDGNFFTSGQAFFNLFLGGEITALGLITTDGDSVTVTVGSTGWGDFHLLAAALKVKFLEVPEPGTALLAGVAGLLVALVRRRS